MTEIQCPLSQAAELYGDLPALVTDNQVITYGEYHQLTAAVAGKLQKSGVTAGDRITIVSENRIEYPILLMALFRIGTVACPVSPRLPQKTVVEYIKRINCSKIIDLTNRLHIDKAHGITTLSFKKIIDFSGAGGTIPGDHFISLDQEATIIATSGTSAQPKAVLHTYGNHYYSAIGSNKNIKVQPCDRWLLSLPLYHVGGLAILFRAMLDGGAVVIANKDADLIDTIRQYQVTHLSLVHTQLYHLLKKKPGHDDIKGLSALLVGGSAIPRVLITKAYECGLPLFTSYGLTEMASQVTTTHPGDPLDRLLTSGSPLDHRRVKISSEGEILVKGDTLFRGYVENDGVYLPVDSEGWFHTGDVGHLHDTSYLTIRGRKDNMFISGGENIYPEEIEGTLCLLDSIFEAVIVPIEDSEFGFRPVAFLRIADNQDVRKSDIVAKLEQHLPRFKIPVRFYHWPETGQESDVKPYRRYFRELLQVTSHKLTELT